MTIVAVFIILCIALVIGLGVPFAFGLAMLYIAFTTGTDPSNYLVSGQWGMNTIVLLAIPLFIMAGGIMNRLNTRPRRCCGTIIWKIVCAITGTVPLNRPLITITR